MISSPLRALGANEPGGSDAAADRAPARRAGRGQKGQNSRSGGGVPAGFEGGQMPLQRRLPKLGFTSRKAPFNDEVKVGSLARLAGDEVSPERLKEAGLVKRRAKRIKLIAGGEAGSGVHRGRGRRERRAPGAVIEAAGGMVSRLMARRASESARGRPSLGSGKMSELRQRLLFVLGAILIFRIGSFIPVPGIDPVALEALFEQQRGTILDMFNMFSGGALSRFSIFAIGIMPYISAAIIMQLLSAVHPKLEQLKKEGEQGRRKITQYTRYGTVALATFQALGRRDRARDPRARAARRWSSRPGLGFRITTVVTLVTGTIFLMWLGEQVSERGIGNGISIIIFAGIVAGLPVGGRRHPGARPHRGAARAARPAPARPSPARRDRIRGVRGAGPAAESPSTMRNDRWGGGCTRARPATSRSSSTWRG